MLSSTLSIVFMDDLSAEQNKFNSGCYIGYCLLSYLMFADDLCMICLNASSLHEISEICEAYVKMHGIVFDCKKTVLQWPFGSKT